MATMSKPVKVTRSIGANSPADAVNSVLSLIKETGVQVVDVKFTDLPGQWQNFSLPAASFDADVFTYDVIETWVNMKRTKDLPAVNLRPHPYEFFLYYDT